MLGCLCRSSKRPNTHATQNSDSATSTIRTLPAGQSVFHHSYLTRLLAHYTRSISSPLNRCNLHVRLRSQPLGPHTLLLLRLEMVLILVTVVALMHVGALPRHLGAGTGSVVEALFAHTVLAFGSAVGALFVFGAGVLPPVAVAVDARNLCRSDWCTWGWCESLGASTSSGSRG
jgi:hypothetical protein